MKILTTPVIHLCVWPSGSLWMSEFSFIKKIPVLYMCMDIYTTTKGKNKSINTYYSIYFIYISFCS